VFDFYQIFSPTPDTFSPSGMWSCDELDYLSCTLNSLGQHNFLRISRMSCQFEKHRKW
jgi:hypothetical protein